MTVFPVRLALWMEVIGQLLELIDQDGCLVARIGSVEVLLPSELKEKLASFVGQKIGILRTDIDYRMRIIGVRV